MGHPAVHHGAEGAVGVQREPLHLHDHLQRVPALNLPKRLHVSIPGLGCTNFSYAESMENIQCVQRNFNSLPEFLASPRRAGDAIHVGQYISS